MSYKYDYLVFIGRFQPVHNGHLNVIRRALELSEKIIIVLGSHNQPRSLRNPWTSQERKQMILDSMMEITRGTDLFDRVAAYSSAIDFAYQEDYTYNLDKWVSSIQGQVNHIINKKWKAGPTKIGLIGHAKDHSSFYLNLFPQWGSENVEQYVVLDATTVREDLFNPWTLMFPRRAAEMPIAVVEYLESWAEENPKDFEYIRAENEHLISYKKSWSHSPFPPTFNTVDAVVVQSGHILMIERGAMPGLGQLAIPGGFINQFETIEDAMIRELREETKIKVPAAVLRGSIKQVKVYDDPYRSQRGRTITHAHYIHLTDMQELPKVKGSDDAAKAKWIPLNDLDRGVIFEDHFDIIDDMVKL